MPDFDLTTAVREAERRFGTPTSRKARSDRGLPRIDPAVASHLESLLRTQERRPVREILQKLESFCRERGLRCPARATVYEWMDQLPPAAYRAGDLPAHVRETLYNLDEDSVVPADQLAFHCLNYGTTRAISFAGGLPWLALHQAARLRGWRPRSRGLLDAILRVRRI